MTAIQRTSVAALLVALALFCPVGAAAQPLTVTLETGQHIRDVAREYLGDPDLWEQILELNGLASVLDLKPGMKLTVPSTEVSRAAAALAAALATIDEAGENGAQLLAAAELEEALALRNEALAARREARWEETLALARKSLASAEAALALARERRLQQAEALLEDRLGTVDARKPGALTWRDAPKQSKLVEEEKVRTLSSSLASILFPDRSSLRLDENSQAVIQSLRRDALSHRRQSKVQLIGGNVQAILKGNQRSRQFELGIPGVELESRSRNFWASRTNQKVRLANYDEGRIEVAVPGRDQKVVLERNQGTVADRTTVAPARDLLPPPRGLAPAAPAIAYQGKIELSWEAVDGALAYWVHIAADSASFRKLVVSRRDITGTRWQPRVLPVGLYYWRVSAVDDLGLPGPASTPQWFQVADDESGPYLVVEFPQPDAVTNQPEVEVRGEAERGSQLLVDGETVPLDDDAHFRFARALQPGPNPIRFEAVDRAGNRTVVERTIQRVDVDRVEILLDESLPRRAPSHFLSRTPEFILTGSTVPGSQIELEGDEPRAPEGGEGVAAGAAGVADAAGGFQIRLAATAGGSRYRMRVVSPAGGTAAQELTVELDDTRPELALDTPPPGAISSPVLTLSGVVEEAVSLQLNQEEMPFAEGRFEIAHPLQPGVNPISLEAVDRAGNTRRIVFDIVLDEAPPRLVAHRISRSSAGARIQVDAEDASGLRRVAPVVIEASGAEIQGHLELDRSTGRYSGTLTLPAGTQAPARLRRVRLEDSLGNAQEYQLY